MKSFYEFLAALCLAGVAVMGLIGAEHAMYMNGFIAIGAGLLYIAKTIEKTK
jgi:hypothetical protein